MSHNLYTLNNAGGNVLSYHTVSKGVLYFGRGSTSAYPASLGTGGLVSFEWYAPASERVNTIGATFGTGSATGWINSITLPAGTYMFYFYCLVPTTTSNPSYVPVSYITTNENGVYDGQLNIYNSAYTSVNGRRDVGSYTGKIIREYSISTTLTFNVGYSSGGGISDAGGRISEHQFFFARKL